MSGDEEIAAGIAVFLRARLDEDEAAAKAAAGTAGQWFEPGPSAGEWSVRNNKAIVECPTGIIAFDEGCPTDAQAAHIALHDPARMLREVEAKRAILALHSALPMRGVDAASCRQCRLTWPCPTLQHLAAVYSDHPDYRAEWKP